MKTHFSEKFVLLGHTGYVGEAFAKELGNQGEECLCITRANLNYTNSRTLISFLTEVKPTFLINCAGFTGKPNVDACETRKADVLLGNVRLPEIIAFACELTGIPWGHVSSGCIYSGAKIHIDGSLKTEKNLMIPGVIEKWSMRPEIVEGFSEKDVPNFSFRDLPCSFYSGSKALAEEILAQHSDNYIWRLRIPFDNKDNPRNYLSKIQTYGHVYDNVNSLSHREDFVKACIELYRRRCPYGIYNVTNSGWVTTKQVVELLKKKLKLNREFQFFLSDSEFYEVAMTPRSNTVLDNSKLLNSGIYIRDVMEALEDSLERWLTGAMPN